MHLGTGGASTRSFVLVPHRSRGHLALPGPATPTVRTFRGNIYPTPCPISCLNPAEFVKLCGTLLIRELPHRRAAPARPRYTCNLRRKVTHVCVEIPCRLFALAAILLNLTILYLTMSRVFKSRIFCADIRFLELFFS